jgi:hypothetical protein
MKFTGVKLSGVTVSGLDADYQALLNYAVSQSIPLPNIAQRIRDSDGIIYAKAQGIWAEADVWYKFRSNGSYHVDFACLNWKNPGTFTLQRFNSPTFGADGFTGNGTNMYLDSGWIPNTHGVKFQQNNAGAICYINNLARNIDASFGAENSTSSRRFGFTPRNASNTGSYRTNKDTSKVITVTDSSGLWQQKRTSSSAIAIHRNSALFDSGSVTSSLPTSFAVALLSQNSGGTIDAFSQRNIGLWIAGASFNGLETKAYTWFNNYVA